MSAMAENRIIAIDDDPTGSQTVHSCLLLTRWDVDTLIEALHDASPLFFILSNTRGMDAARAAEVTREICVNLNRALERSAEQGRPINPIVVSRSDSTLRGHYPVETDIIAGELGPFDAHFIVPAFFEAGRFTRDSVHYLLVDGEAVPVDQTEFAQDSVFGFSTAWLPGYVEEKTAGRISAAQVERFLLEEVRGDCSERLRGLAGNACCVVDCEAQQDLDHFADQLIAMASQGKRFLFRSAASLLTAFARLPAQPVRAEHMSAYVRDNRPGVVLVGSHVAKTSAQLRYLIAHTGIVPIEVDVKRLDPGGAAVMPDAIAALADQILTAIYTAHAYGSSVVIYTSREELRFPSRQQRIAFGERVSAFLMELVKRLPESIGFLISKGGITSNDVLSTGLGLKQSRVLGQILTGCSMVRCPDDHERYPGLPVVIFPGNVGDESALARVFDTLTAQQQSVMQQSA